MSLSLWKRVLSAFALTSPNTGWRINVANFAKHHLNISWGIVEKPGHLWLENYVKKHPQV